MKDEIIHIIQAYINVHVLFIVPFKPYNVTVYGINIDGKGIRRTVINFTQEGSECI